ncbi:MAG: hypothetical protein IPG46_08325 [Actinobacteria bacterium]|nr:hypothetical protein [Actinomycetota bacterium]
MTDSTWDATNSTDAYDEHSIQVLEYSTPFATTGHVHRRHRVRRLMHLVWGDRSITPSTRPQQGFANLIEVPLHKDRSVEVTG